MTTVSQLNHALYLAIKQAATDFDAEYGDGSFEANYEIEFDDEYPYVNWDIVESILDGYLGESKEIKQEGLTITLEDSYGGMGQGDEYWMVMKVATPEGYHYFKVDGYYSSYSDYGPFTEVENAYEVQPIEVTSIEWRGIAI